MKGRKRVFGIDVGAEGEIGHYVDVELVVARVTRDGRADGEAALRIKLRTSPATGLPSRSSHSLMAW